MQLIKLITILLFVSTAGAQAQVDSLVRDSIEMQQIMESMTPSQQTSTNTSAASANPNISVIGDFQGQYRSYGSHPWDAVLHEVEFSFESTVDPYIKASFFYAVGQDAATGEFESEVEEGYLTTLSLPAHLQLKAGRFRQNIGRMNLVHPHALPFIDAPDAYAQFFGEEGLKGDGFSLSWLLPNRAFFQELTFEGTAVATNPSFRRSPGNRFLWLAHLKNFWDLTDNATLELGFTGLRGENEFGRISRMLAADLTYKWKPLQYNTYRSLVFQNEFYYSHARSDTGTTNAIGGYSMLSVQVAKRLFVTGRYDYTQAPFAKNYVQQSGSLTLGWNATEFQKIELGLKYTHVNTPVEAFAGDHRFSQAFLRWIFVIGSHGAHMY